MFRDRLQGRSTTIARCSSAPPLCTSSNSRLLFELCEINFLISTWPNFWTQSSCSGGFRGNFFCIFVFLRSTCTQNEAKEKYGNLIDYGENKASKVIVPWADESFIHTPHLFPLLTQPRKKQKVDEEDNQTNSLNKSKNKNKNTDVTVINEEKKGEPTSESTTTQVEQNSRKDSVKGKQKTVKNNNQQLNNNIKSQNNNNKIKANRPNKTNKI